MTRDDAVVMIKFGLGNRTGTELDSAIIARLQQAQRLLEQGRSLPYFLKLEDQTFVLPPGGADVPFPTGFLREVQDETFHYNLPNAAHDTQSLVYLDKVNPREGNQGFVTIENEPGRPRSYSIMRAGFRFYPPRDVTYNLTFSYYKSATPLDSNALDNAWLLNAPDILIGRAGSLMAEIIAHDRAKALFDAMHAAAWGAAFAEGVMREEENNVNYMGSRT